MKALKLKATIVIAVVACLLLSLCACGHTHDAGEWVTDKEATCTADGEKHTECTDCGEVLETKSIPATGHSYTDGVCKNCGADDPEYVDPDAPGGDTPDVPGGDTPDVPGGDTPDVPGGDTPDVPGGDTPDVPGGDTPDVPGVCEHELIHHEAKAPTCIEIGWDAYDECSKCEYTTYVEKAAVGHNEVAHAAKTPTCTEIGWDAYVACTRCDYTTYVEKTALGHDYKLGVCSRCGSKEQEGSTGLEFTPNGDGTCYVGGIGTCEDADIVIPEVSPEGWEVMGIGYRAFEDCSSLTSITIPDSVTSIGYGAFLYCGSLMSITILDNTTDGSGLTSIGDYAFYWCSSLTSIIIPDSVTSIGDRAFSGCSLTSIIIPDSVTSIGDRAFSDCGLTSITIPDSVTSIGGGAFSYCRSLASITVGSNNAAYKSVDGNLYTKDGKTLVQYAIGKTATEFIVPDSITSIGSSAFSYCSSLASITIPDSVTSIGKGAFAYCSGLNAVYITDLVRWCNINFGDASANPLYYAMDLYLNGGLIVDLVIPNGVTGVANYAFYCYGRLTSITIPDSVTSIGDEAFFGCGNLTCVTIGNRVTSIGYEAFSCCGLTSITIPDSVTSIGYAAFSSCGSLTNVTIPDSVTNIGEYAFFDCNSLTSVTFENAEGWWRYSSSTATNGKSISSSDLADTAKAAKYLTDTYDSYYWKRG